MRNFLTIYFFISVILGCSGSGGLSPATDISGNYPIVSSCSAPTAASFNTVITATQYSTASTNNFLSVYTPTSGSNWPLVIWIHGGGWDNTALFYNTTFTTNEIVRYMIGQGFAVASVDYRYTTALNNPAVLPAQIQDVRCATMWLTNHAASLGISTRYRAVMGESAGGHLAAMIAMNLANNSSGTGFDDPSHCSSFPGDATVTSAALFYPIVDLRASTNVGTSAIAGLACSSDQDCLVKALGGTPESLPMLAASVSPITYISSTTAPIMITMGTTDADVMVGPVRNFRSAIAAFNRPVTYVELAASGHGFLATDTANYWALNGAYAPSVCTMLNFLQKTLTGN